MSDVHKGSSPRHQDGHRNRTRNERVNDNVTGRALWTRGQESAEEMIDSMFGLSKVNPPSISAVGTTR